MKAAAAAAAALHQLARAAAAGLQHLMMMLIAAPKQMQCYERRGCHVMWLHASRCPATFRWPRPCSGWHSQTCRPLVLLAAKEMVAGQTSNTSSSSN